jgi:hypothetical protein
MVAEVPLMPLEVTALMVGIVAGVAKVKLADVAVPAESVDNAA